jgi:N-acetylglucosamine-6-phosphate deacetylase
MSTPHLLIHGGVTPTATAGLQSCHIQITGETITGLTTGQTPVADTRLDATGCTVLPGLIDVHVHGAMGHDTMDANSAALAAMAHFFARHGVTSFLPTTMTAEPAATLAAVESVAAYLQSPAPGARVLGVHLEGPFISPQFPGAQLADAIRPPDLAEFAALTAAGP